MRRLAITVASALAVLILAAAGAVAWLLYSEGGAAWAWSRAEAATAGRLSATAVQGTLAGGLHIRELRYADVVRIAGLQVALDPGLVPPALEVNGLRVSGLEVRSATGDSAAGGEAPALQELLAALRLPLRLRISDARLDDARIATGAAESWRIRQASLTAALDESLAIERLTVGTADASLRLAATIELAAPHALTAELEIDATPDGIAGERPLEVDAQAAGSLERLELTVTSPSHGIDVEGVVTDVDRAPRLRLRASAPRLTWPLEGAAPRIAARNLELVASGTAADYRLQLGAELSTGTLAPVRVDASLDGDRRGLRVTSASLRGPELAADLEGTLRWVGTTAVDARVDLLSGDPSPWVAAWPAGAPVAGTASVAWTGTRLTVDTFGLELVRGAARLEGRAVVDLETGAIDGRLSWQDLRWPLAVQGEPVIESPTAALGVRGRLDAWTVTGDVALETADLQAGRFTFSGSGDRRGIDVDIEDSSVLGGRLTGTLALDWVEAGAFTARLEAEDVTVTPFAPAWPGRVSAAFTARGQRRPLRLALDIEELDGELRARRVSARGRLELGEGGVLRADDLRLASGESMLALHGAWPAGDGLRGRLDVASLGDFVPAAIGRLSASAVLKPGAGLPRLALTVEAEELAWQGLHVERLTLENAPQAGGPPLAVSLAAENPGMGGRRLDRVALRLDGTPAAHRLELTAARAAERLRVLLAGGLDDARAGLAARWRGRLRELELTAADAPAARLRAAAPLEISRDDIDLGRACFDGAGQGGLCATLGWGRDGRFAADIAVTDMPLDPLRLLGAENLRFTQSLSGAVRIARSPGGRMAGSGRLDLTPGVIQDTFDSRLRLRTGAGHASFALADGQLLTGELELPLGDRAAEIGAGFRVLDVSRGGDSPVEGRVRVDIGDIGVGASIAPYVDEAAGRLATDVRIEGSLGAPQFRGSVSLHDGMFLYEPLGLRLDELSLDANILPGNRIELESAFRAGDGTARLSSTAAYLRGQTPGIEFELAGENLNVIGLEDLNVTVDPELSIGVRDGEVALNGRVVVPAARLASVNILPTGVSESGDVRLVDAQAVANNGEPRSESALRYNGEVELVLGDDVVIDVDVAEARVRGRSRFLWDGPAMPQARGLYEVSGRFEAFGQLLEITEGNIRYAGGPADNPELRIRAEREIFGNSQVRRAGVLIAGTATRPTLDVYTTPATTRDRALTLLATGSDFNYEQGVGAVDVGTYIAPGLYASYGIGLFDRENVISVRYDLARGFGIKASSGKRTAGVDLSYTIEN